MKLSQNISNLNASHSLHESVLKPNQHKVWPEINYSIHIHIFIFLIFINFLIN